MNWHTDAECRAFDAGNFANAYETADWEAAWEDHCEEHAEARHAFLLGFFSSYELHEVSEDVRDEVEIARWTYGDDESEARS